MTSLIPSLVQALDLNAKTSLVVNFEKKIVNFPYDADQSPQIIDALAETVALLKPEDWAVCRRHGNTLGRF